jgi:hypothetical protein
MRACECGRPAVAKGLCATCYSRRRRAGLPHKKIGRPTPPDLAIVRRTFPDWSPSTIARWTQAMRILRVTGDQTAATAAIKAATRPNGTVNVSVIVRLADAALMRFVAAEPTP